MAARRLPGAEKLLANNSVFLFGRVAIFVIVVDFACFSGRHSEIKKKKRGGGLFSNCLEAFFCLPFTEI